MERTDVLESSSRDESEVGKLGIWFFILTEMLLFGALLGSYTLTRIGSPLCGLGNPAWPQPHYLGGLSLALINTVVLITSSLTMACAYAATLRKDRITFNTYQTITIVLGILFLAVKTIEYGTKVHHGYLPTGPIAQSNPGLSIFLSYYFALTGLHALHVLAGVLWNFFLLRSSKATGMSDRLSGKVNCAALYWHFVDVVWVFLFPLFYLI